MTIPQPIAQKRPVFTDAERVRMIANEILMFRTFPNHLQAGEFARNIEIAKAKLPNLYAAAEVMATEQMATQNYLIEYPDHCPRCQGSGIQQWKGRDYFCGCPRGERMSSHRQPLPRVPRLAAIVGRPKSDRQLLAEVATWVPGEGDGDV